MSANNADPPNANAMHTFSYADVRTAPNWQLVQSDQYPRVSFFEKKNNKSNRRWTHPSTGENDAYKFVDVVENTTLPAGWRKLVHKQEPGFVYYEDEATGESTFRRPVGAVMSAKTNNFNGVMNKISALEQTLQSMEKTLKNAKANTAVQAGGRTSTKKRRATRKHNKRRATMRRK